MRFASKPTALPQSFRLKSNISVWGGRRGASDSKPAAVSRASRSRQRRSCGGMRPRSWSLGELLAWLLGSASTCWASTIRTPIPL